MITRASRARASWAAMVHPAAPLAAVFASAQYDKLAVRSKNSLAPLVSQRAERLRIQPLFRGLDPSVKSFVGIVKQNRHRPLGDDVAMVNLIVDVVNGATGFAFTRSQCLLPGFQPGKFREDPEISRVEAWKQALAAGESKTGCTDRYRRRSD